MPPAMADAARRTDPFLSRGVKVGESESYGKKQ